MITPATSRRGFLQNASTALFGLSLAEMLALQNASAGTESSKRRAKRCIVLFAWGGMSHLDSWDMKPEASSDIRGEFRPIPTAKPGLQICEHMPHLAKRTDKLTIVRSMHHKAADHREAAYWNLTGHQPKRLGAPAIEPSKEDWPSLGSMVSFAMQNQTNRNGLPGAVSIPYPIADRGLLNGQYAGMLGKAFEPLYIKCKSGKPFAGVSPPIGELSLDPVAGLTTARLAERSSLVAQLESANQNATFSGAGSATAEVNQYRAQAYDMVSNAKVREAFDLSKESPQVRQSYGDHICGQSALLARRVTDAGVPMAMVYCCAGDLNGSAGSHWDTHGDGFRRLKNDMLPPLDQASGALLDDLESTGKLSETLVVWLTEFGRTPQVSNGGGRNHFPNCYSVAFAGAGIEGGRAYGSSNKIGSEPHTKPCGPEEVHATIFRAMGIDPNITFLDLKGRPRMLCEAEPLPLW